MRVAERRNRPPHPQVTLWTDPAGAMARAACFDGWTTVPLQSAGLECAAMTGSAPPSTHPVEEPALSQVSWLALGAAILVATLTVVILTAFGPAWPRTFADCGGEGVMSPGSADRVTAVREWRKWWTPVFFVGFAACAALVVAWLATHDWRTWKALWWPVGILGGVLVVALVIVPVVIPVVFGLPWATILGFPDRTPIRAPVCFVMTCLFGVFIREEMTPRTQKWTQVGLAVLLATAWIGLASTGVVSEGAFIC